MKLSKIILSLILVSVICLSFFACGGSKATVNVKISTDEYGVMSEDTLEITSKDATVLDVISDYCSQKGFAYEYNADGNSISSIGEFKETEKNKLSYFWNYTVNGNEISGRAADNAVADGDTVVYNYTSVPTGDSVTVKFVSGDTEVVKETIVVFEEGATVYDAAVNALKLSGVAYDADDEQKAIQLVGEYQAKSTPTYDEAWDFTVNGKKPKDTADVLKVKNNDKIVFEFNKVEKEVIEELN